MLTDASSPPVVAHWYLAVAPGRSRDGLDSALIYEKGATHQEIGERMGGLPARTVEARMRRVRNIARRLAASGEITVALSRRPPVRAEPSLTRKFAVQASHLPR